MNFPKWLSIIYIDELPSLQSLVGERTGLDIHSRKTFEQTERSLCTQPFQYALTL